MIEAAPPPPPPLETPSHMNWLVCTEPPLNTDHFNATLVTRVGKHALGDLIMIHRDPTGRERLQLPGHPGATILFKVVARGKEGRWQERVGLKFYAPDYA